MAMEKLTDINKRAFTFATIETAPEIMILHVERFTFYNETEKVNKFVCFNKTLSIKSHLHNQNDPLHEYLLYAVVTHHGKTATSGHYTADIIQIDGSWLCFNDSKVSLIQEKDVLSRNAYLLFYKRNRK